eukprot:TRINITY_DN12790_c0_g1_i1.p1 TRINITY_DN12790_c0_g1~~TRINITY_DN12790_c0_g1_i1.p1  ORF type:complete len:368 (+),score=73.12 TRINITY_DN12790_c0_g1_i1:27-1106(+)
MQKKLCDPLVFLSEKEIKSSITTSDRFHVGFAHTPGRKTNSNKQFVMEDYILVKGNFRNSKAEDLYAVFDGHDGKRAAEYASEKFGEILETQLGKVMPMGDGAGIPDDAIYVGDIDLEPPGDELTSAQRRVAFALSESFKQMTEHLKVELDQDYGGTTALVVFAMGDDLYVANVGDTAAVLGSKSQCERVSKDHRPVDEERTRIEESGGKIYAISVPRVEGMLAITRSLGDFDLTSKGIIWNPNVKVLTDFRRKGEFAILASDGIWDLISDQQAVDAVCAILEEHEPLPTLKKGAKRGGHDDEDDMFSFDDEASHAKDESEDGHAGGGELETQICQRLVEMSFEKLSIDNISVIVLRWD